MTIYRFDNARTYKIPRYQREREESALEKTVGAVTDTAIDVGRGTIGLGRMAAGIGDFVASPFREAGEDTFTHAYDESIAGDADRWLEDQYSRDRQRQERRYERMTEQDDSIIGTAKALWENPRVAIGRVFEAAPSFAAGAGVGGLAGRGAAALGASATGAANAARVGAALGEGSLTAGSVAGEVAEYNREHGRDPAEGMWAPVVAGVGTAGIARLGSKLGGGVEEAIFNREATKKLSGFGRSMLTEGVEEGLQAAPETIPQNVATDNPWDEGLQQSITESAVAGGMMGGGASLYARNREYRLNKRDQVQILSEANTGRANTVESEQTPPSTVPPTDPSEETEDGFDYDSLPDPDKPDDLRTYVEGLQAEADTENTSTNPTRAANAVDDQANGSALQASNGELGIGAENSTMPVPQAPDISVNAEAPVSVGGGTLAQQSLVSTGGGTMAPQAQPAAEPQQPAPEQAIATPGQTDEVTNADWRKVFRGLYDPSKPIKQTQLDELKRARQSPFGDSVMVALANASRAVSGNKPPFSAHNIAAITDNLTDGAETVEDVALALEAEADRMPARQENSDKMDAYRLAAALLRDPNTDTMAFMEEQRQRHIKEEEETKLAKVKAEAERVQKKLDRQNASVQGAIPTEGERRLTKAERKAQNQAAYAAQKAEEEKTRLERKAAADAEAEQRKAQWKADKEEAERKRLAEKAAKKAQEAAEKAAKNTKAKAPEAPKSQLVAEAQTQGPVAPAETAPVETAPAKEQVDPPLKWNAKDGPVKVLRQWATDYETANGEKPTQAQLEAKSRQLTDENGLDKYQDIHAKQFNDVVKGGVTNAKKGTRAFRREKTAYYEAAVKRGLANGGPKTDLGWRKYLQEDYEAEKKAGRISQILIDNGFKPSLSGIGHKGDESVRLKHGKVARELAEKAEAAKANTPIATPEAPKVEATKTKTKPKRTRAKKKAEPAAPAVPAQEVPTASVDATETVAPAPQPVAEAPAPAKPKRTRKSTKNTAVKAEPAPKPESVPAPESAPASEPEPAPAKSAQEVLVERLKAEAAAKGVTQENIDTMDNSGEARLGRTSEEVARDERRKNTSVAYEKQSLEKETKSMKPVEKVRYLQNYVNATVRDDFDGDRVSRLSAVANIVLNHDLGLRGESHRKEISRTLDQALRSPRLSDEEHTRIAQNMRNAQPELSESADATIERTRAMEEAERVEAAAEEAAGWKSGFASLRNDLSNDTAVREAQQKEAEKALGGDQDVTDNSSAYAGLESDIEDAQNRDANRHGSEGEEAKGGGVPQDRTKSTGRWGESWVNEAKRRVLNKVNKTFGNPVKARDMEAGNYGPLYDALKTPEGQQAFEDALYGLPQEMSDDHEKYDIARNKKFSKKIDIPAALTGWMDFLEEVGIQLDNDPVLAHLVSQSDVAAVSTTEMEQTAAKTEENVAPVDEGPSEEERALHRASFANAVKKSKLYDVVDKLIKDGKLEIVNRPEDVLSADVIKAEMNANPGKVIKGAYDRKTGKAYLFMDNIGNHEIDTVILHEVGIHMLGDDAFMNRLAQGLAVHVMRHANMYGDLPKQGAAVFKGYDFNSGKMNAEQEEWVANALSAVMASRGAGFRDFLDWMAGVAKEWYAKLTGGKYEPRPEAFVNMAESQLRSAVANGRAAKRGEDKVLFYTAMRDEDAAQSIVDKLPKSTRRVAINAQNRFFKTGLGMMFTKDLVDLAKSKGILGESLQRYTQAEENIQTFRNDWESKVAGTGRKFQELSEAEQTEVNKLLADSTLEGVWAYRDEKLFDDAQWQKVYDKYTDAQKAKMQEMQTRFNNLSPKAKETVKEVFRQGDTSLKTLLDVIEKNVEKNFQSRLENAKTKEDKERIQRELNAEKRRLRKPVSADPTKPYAPLRRFGSHVVVMKSKRLASMEALIRTAREMANERTGGKPTARDLTVVHRLEEQYDKMIQNPSEYLVEFAESAGDAQLRKEELMKEYPRNSVSAFEKAMWLRDQVPGWQQLEQSMKMFKNSAELDAAVSGKNVKQGDLDEIEAMLRELYVRSLTDASARKSELKRRKVSGFNQNMMASFLEAERANAVRLAQIKFGGDLRDALSEMQKEARVSKDEATAMRFVNEFRARHALSLNSNDSKLVNRALRTSSFFMLLTNPSFHLANLTQPFMMTAPYMAARHGGRAVTELAKTIKDVGMAMRADASVDGLKNAKIMSDEEFEALDRARDAGHIDIGITQDFGQATGKPTVLSKVVDRLTTATRAAETMNRTASFLTAFRLEYARTKDKDAAYRYADDVVYRTHGDYSGFNAPRYFNMNGFTKIATQFRKFQLIQLSLMLRMANQAFKGATPEEKAVGRRALAYTMGIHFALTGLKGTPFIGTVLGLASMVLGMGDDGDDSEDKLREWIGDKDLADVLLNGLPFAGGMDLTGKLGAGQMLSIAPYADLDFFDPTLTGKDIVQRAGFAAMGATGSLVAKQLDAAMKLANGDVAGATQNFLPTGLANVAKALKMTSTGITTKSGDVAIPSSEFTAGELLMQALGIPLSKTSERNRMLDTTIRHEKNFDARADKIRKEYREAVKNRDSKAQREARRDWTELRKDMKAEKLRPLPMSSLTKSANAQRKRERNMVGGVASTKANREFLKKWSNL